MKHVFAITTAMLLLCGVAAAKQSESRPEPDKKTPTHTPEWSDHDTHDPGIAKAEKTKPGAQVAPSQNTIRVAPAALQPQGPCTPNEGSAPTAGATDSAGGKITFGDGEHGRIPEPTSGDCARTHGEDQLKNGATQNRGDPDRPVITGHTKNSDKKD